MATPVTLYQDVQFPKRIEARWAAFFTAIKAYWRYNPAKFTFFDGESYTPDLCVTMHGAIYYAEINLEPNPKIQPRLVKLAREHKVNVLSIVGHPHEQTYKATLISVNGIKPVFEPVQFAECIKCGQVGLKVCANGSWKNSPKVKAALKAARDYDFGGGE